MATLPDEKCLSELSIPGTHNTMSFHTQQLGNDLVWCQSLDLELQISMGIRFFDIRCRNFDDVLPLHHEQFFLDCYFDDVLGRVTKYLKEHPHEFFIMNVQEEYHEGRARNRDRNIRTESQQISCRLF